MSQSELTQIVFELKSRTDVLRTSVRCPGCNSSYFYIRLKDHPVSRCTCKICGEVYTFPSSLLVPLKHLSKIELQP